MKSVMMAWVMAAGMVVWAAGAVGAVGAAKAARSDSLGGSVGDSLGGSVGGSLGGSLGGSVGGSVGDTTGAVARNRGLVAKHAAGAVKVKIKLVQGEAEEGEGFVVPYMCPNCDRVHTHDLREYVEKDRPLEMVGYLVGNDRVMIEDLSIQSNFVGAVSVEVGGVEYPATAVRRFPKQSALELRTAKPIAGAKPYAFKDAKGELPARFFYTTREKGQTISGLIAAGGLRVRHYAEQGQDLVKLPGASVALDRDGEPISLSFRSELPYDEVAFTPPASWQGEEPYAFDARIAALKAQLATSLVPVFIHREVDKRGSSRGSSRHFVNGEEIGGEGKTDLDTIGFALENGELLVPLEFNASQTAEIDKLEAVLADGKRVALEYVGAFDRYALAVLRFADGKLPAGVKPMKFRTGKCQDLYARTIFTAAVRSLDGRFTISLTPEKVVEFEAGRGGEYAPDVSLGNSRGRRSFAVTAEGEFVVGGFRSRDGDRWSSGQDVAASTLMKLVKDRAFNPEYALRKGKDRIRVAWIGVETQSLTAELAREKKATGYLQASGSSGVLVSRVHAESPAAKAGLKEGDVLIYARRKGEAKRTDLEARDMFGGSMLELGELLDKLEGERLGMLDADRFAPWPDVEGGVNEVFTRFGIGAEVVVAYVRDGEKKEATMKLAQAPVHFRSSKRFKSKDMGAVFAELTFEVRGYFKLADDAPGVVVCKVQPGNPAAVAGLKPLEIVTHVDDQPVKTLAEFRELVKGKKEFSLSVRRLEKTRVLRIKLGEKNASEEDKQ